MGGGPSGETEARQERITDRELAISESSERRAQRTWDLVFPGMERAEQYYTNLASGDPMAIFREIAPATEAITAQGAAAKERLTEMPRGGEQRLAQEMVDIQTAGQIGQLATRSYTSAFPALAALAGQGMGLSINEVANAIQAGNVASQSNASIMQAEAQGKAATMGFLGEAAGGGSSAAGSIGAAAKLACWIAEVLFGRGWRWRLVRAWLHEHYAKTWVGSIVVAAYQRWGIPVASVLARHQWARWPFRILFDHALRRATEYAEAGGRGYWARLLAEG